MSVASAGAASISTVDARPLQALRVLVVEDESIVSFMLETLLLRHGCRAVAHAASVAAALAALDRDTPDAAVLDINLGDELVYPVAERLRADRVPFVFATGYNPNRLPATWRPCPIVQKPYDGTRLVQALRHALDLAANAMPLDS